MPEISAGHHNLSLLPSYQRWTFARCGSAGIFLDEAAMLYFLVLATGVAIGLVLTDIAGR